MKIKVHFHTSLHKYTSNVSEFTFDVADFLGLSYALKSTFEELILKFTDISNFETSKDLLLILDQDKKLITETTIIKNPKYITEVYVVPTISGGGGGKSGIILGAAIAAFAFFALPALLAAGGAVGAAGGAAGGAAVGGAAGGAAGGSFLAQSAAAYSGLTGVAGYAAQTLMGIGINLILGGIMSLFQKKPSAPEQETDIQDRKDNDAFGSLTNSTDSSNSLALIYGMHRQGGQFVSGYVKTANHGKNDIVKVGEEFNV